MKVFPGQYEDSPILEEKRTLLSETWNVLRAVRTIDEYCTKLAGRCWRCPLHRQTKSYEYVCQVARKKWKELECRESETYDISWEDRRSLLANHRWLYGRLGNNRFWYKKKTVLEVSILKNMSDQDFISLLGGDKECR